MKFNAYKNIGELYERIGEFVQAKDFYTLVRKLKILKFCFRLLKSKKKILLYGPDWVS